MQSSAFSLSAEMALHFTEVENGSYSELWHVDVNLLTKVESEKLTEDLALQPILQAFGGVVLDDLNTSNCHIYLNHEVLKGHVLFLSHDGDTRIVYSSLAEFMMAVDKAKHEKISLTDLHPPNSPTVPDQGALSQMINVFLDQGNEDAEAAILALVPSMDLQDEQLLMRLVTDSNFFFGEAVALELEKRPAANLLNVAELCTRHEHFQASNAGRRARDVVKLLERNN